MAGKLTRILTELDSATSLADLRNPEFRLHPLKGNLAGYWSIRLTGNWRVIFRFSDGEALGVELIDYH